MRLKKRKKEEEEEKKNITFVVRLPYLWKTWGECLSTWGGGENCGLDVGKFVRETARQLRTDTGTI